MRIAYLLVAVLGVVGCAVTAPSVNGVPAASSKFSKVQLGESQNQVENDIGKSKDCNVGLDPESAFIANVSIKICVYKGEGTLVFLVADGALHRINVDTKAGEFMSIKQQN